MPRNRTQIDQNAAFAREAKRGLSVIGLLLIILVATIVYRMGGFREQFVPHSVRSAETVTTFGSRDNSQIPDTISTQGQARGRPHVSRVYVPGQFNVDIDLPDDVLDMHYAVSRVSPRADADNSPEPAGAVDPPELPEPRLAQVSVGVPHCAADDVDPRRENSSSESQGLEVAAAHLSRAADSLRDSMPAEALPLKPLSGNFQVDDSGAPSYWRASESSAGSHWLPERAQFLSDAAPLNSVLSTDANSVRSSPRLAPTDDQVEAFASARRSQSSEPDLGRSVPPSPLTIADTAPTSALVDDRCWVEMGDGDSLWSISQRFYGDGRWFRALYMYNQQNEHFSSQLGESSSIEIPNPSVLVRRFGHLVPEDLKQAIAAATPTAGQPLHRWYLAEQGETLFNIARDELGQASRYLEILRLNSDRLPREVGPDAPLPGTLHLRLPMD